MRGTWEKLPSKYEKLFSDLQDLFDPSRNMAKYRNVLNSQNLQPPIIPLFPVIKKDLTFLHEGKTWGFVLSSLLQCCFKSAVKFPKNFLFHICLMQTASSELETLSSSFRQRLKSRRAGELREAAYDCEGDQTRGSDGSRQHGPGADVPHQVSVFVGSCVIKMCPVLSSLKAALH